MARESHPIRLNGKTFPVRFTTRSIARLDAELGAAYGHGFAKAAAMMADGDVRMDLLVAGLKYGLRDEYPGISDGQVIDLIENRGELKEVDVWNVVIEAYFDDRDMRLERLGVEDDEEEAEPGDPKLAAELGGAAGKEGTDPNPPAKTAGA